MNKLSFKLKFKWRKFFTSGNTRIRCYLYRHIPMGLKLNIIVLIVTIVVTLSTTALMCFCVVTDYWEIVAYPLSNIEKILNISDASERPTSSEPKVNVNGVLVESLYDEKIILIKEDKEVRQMMIQMHAGLWSICYDVSGIFLIFMPEYLYLLSYFLQIYELFLFLYFQNYNGNKSYRISVIT